MHLEISSRIQAKENSRQNFLLRRDIITENSRGVSQICNKVLETLSFQKFTYFEVTFLLVFSRFYADSTVLVNKAIFVILVFDIFISFIYI